MHLALNTSLKYTQPCAYVSMLIISQVLARSILSCKSDHIYITPHLQHLTSASASQDIDTANAVSSALACTPAQQLTPPSSTSRAAHSTV